MGAACSNLAAMPAAWFEGDGHAVRACRATVLMRAAARSAELCSWRQGHAANGAGVHARSFHSSPGTTHRVAADRPRMDPPGDVEHLAARNRDQSRDRSIAAARCLGEARGAGALLRKFRRTAKMPAETAAEDVRGYLAHCLSGRALRPGRRRSVEPSRHVIHPLRRYGAMIEQRDRRARRSSPDERRGGDARAEGAFLASDVVPTAAS
jgi:hypothetical protein